MTDTAELNFNLDPETKDKIAAGIPLGPWTGIAQGLRFRRQCGTSKKTGNKYDIRTLRVAINAIGPLSGDDVADGKISENLGNLSYELRAGGVDRTLSQIGKLVKDLNLNVAQSDVDGLVSDLAEAVDTDGDVDYEKVEKAVYRFGHQFVAKTDVVFDLKFDDADDFAPYKAENVRPAP
jgi:hypothetical protein